MERYGDKITDFYFSVNYGKVMFQAKNRIDKLCVDLNG